MKKQSRQIRSVKRAVRAGKQKLQLEHPDLNLITEVIPAKTIIKNRTTVQAQANSSNQQEES